MSPPSLPPATAQAATVGTAYLPLAVLTGSLGSLASVFSKLAASPADTLGPWIAWAFQDSAAGAVVSTYIPFLGRLSGLKKRASNSVASFGIDCSFAAATKTIQAFRTTCVGLTVLANVLMWMSFTKALGNAPSSVHVTTASNAANVIVAAACGYVLFGDKAIEAPQWWAGVACVLVGAALVGRGTALTASGSDAKDKEM
ncbi:hypothetical protein BDZ88DRAFT_408137 [Geranomyces variabilis]|nr:hypothetical protein BDZ88DRAFT_408137 [Geranomyces variabilis]KAJ3142270.1 hypothetical protein HDU90_004543 [Geranomyces variabilis]